MVSQYGGSLDKALGDTFPTLFIPSKLSSLFIFINPHLGPDNKEKKPHGYWHNSENVRAFFYDFAKEHQFDPLIADNWRNVTSSQFAAKVNLLCSLPDCIYVLIVLPDLQGGAAILALYNGSLSRSLRDAFKELEGVTGQSSTS